jgi:AMMECR1 domain-containing protein
MQRKPLTPEEAIERVQHEGTRQFVLRYLDLLKKSLKLEQVKGDSYECSYYTCGETHDRHNPNWKPFGILEKCCKKARLSPLALKEMIEEQIGKKIICECEILSDPKEIKRKRLSAAFGVDFGESGMRNMDVV